MIMHSQVMPMPLIRRQIPAVMVLDGQPQVSGRLVSMTEDGRTARVVWESRPVTFDLSPDPSLIEVGLVLLGRASIFAKHEPARMIDRGTLIEFPRGRCHLQVLETLPKVSLIGRPDGLKLNVEPF